MLIWILSRLQKMLEPRSTTLGDDQRRQARLLATFTLIFIPIGSIIILFRWLTFHNISTLIIGGAVMFGFLCVFLVSRTHYYQIGGLVLVFMITLVIIISLTLDLNAKVPLTYISFSSLVAVIVLTAPYALAISILNIIVAYYLTYHTSFILSVAPDEDFTFLVIMTIVVWIITLLRRFDLQEIMTKNQQMLALKDQQMNLELETRKTTLLRHFIQDISHDLKTPISVIKTSLYILQRQVPAEHHNRLTLIDQQAEYLNQIIEDLISMSRLDEITALEMYPVDINAMLMDICKQLTVTLQDKNHTLKVAYADGLMPILGDEPELRRCFLNLIQNAIAYTPEGGTITVKSSVDGKYIQVDIEDTGIGISEDELPLVFERFYRVDKARTLTHHGGSGLGLAIVNRVVELHHGEINVTSTPDQGSIFSVRLPVSR